MSRKVSPEDVLRAMAQATAYDSAGLSAPHITELVQGSPATVRRHLQRLAAAGRVSRSGAARATRYALLEPVEADAPATLVAREPDAVYAPLHMPWSTRSQGLLK